MVRPLTVVALLAATFGAAEFAGAASTVYNRTAAVAYADANYNKVVGDGYFYESSYPATLIGAGQPVPSGVTGDDCAHFVSSALGSYTGTTAGGLIIPNRAGTYGEPGAARLDELLVGSSLGGYGTTYQYGQLVTSVDQLTPGDVIGYDWDGSGHGSMSGIDHTAIYVGNNQIDCHSNSRLKATWTLGGADDYFFIHITLPDTIVPTTPSNVSPAPNTSLADLTPSLTASAFSDGALGSTHAAAEWKILSSARGATVYDSGTDTTNLTSFTVPDGKLLAGVSYTWQVRYQDNYGGWSSYSTPTALSIVAPPVLGDYNNDGLVDSADYVVWRNNQGTSVALQNDAIGGRIGQAQYDQWRAHFGQTGGISSGALVGGAVPEPATLSLMVLAAASVWARQRRRALSTSRLVNG